VIAMSMFAPAARRVRRSFQPSNDTLPSRLLPTVFPPLPPMAPMPINPPCSADLDLPGWNTPTTPTNPTAPPPIIIDPNYPMPPADDLSPGTVVTQVDHTSELITG
jgi:hypothetical protein